VVRLLTVLAAIETRKRHDPFRVVISTKTFK
jgi:hypothetical protein